MGKEVIVDPTDTPDELTAEQLNATNPVIYREARKQYEALWARIRSAGISIVAREAGVSRSAVKALVYQRTVSHRPRIVKIKAALERLGAAALGGS